MSTPAEEVHRMTADALHDSLDAFRIQMQAGPVSEKALTQLCFRVGQSVEDALAPYSIEKRGALLPCVVRMLVGAFFAEIEQPSPSPYGKKGGA